MIAEINETAVLIQRDNLFCKPPQAQQAVFKLDIHILTRLSNRR